MTTADEMTTETMTKIAEATTAAVSTWKIDPAHSAAQFSVRHMMISNVRGEFKHIDATLELNEEDIARSKIHAEVDAASISTREEKRDEHLKSPDFFDVEKYPKLTFESANFAKKGGGLEITGNLTMRGVTKEVTLKSEDGFSAEGKNPYGQTIIAISAATKVDRKAFGLEWNMALEAGGVLVSETVTITIDAEFVKQ